MLAHFDLVFCMDASAAMESELRRVTRMVMRLLDDLIERAGNVGHEVHFLRARLVVFRSCGTEPIQESRFFTMPQEASEFARHLTSVQAAGGEPGASGGLAALACAIGSDWQYIEGEINRQCIVLFTASPPQPLEGADAKHACPDSMPRDFEALTAMWNGDGAETAMDQRSKRLYLFAPECPEWQRLASAWNNMMYVPCPAGRGLEAHEYEWIVHTMVE